MSTTNSSSRRGRISTATGGTNRPQSPGGGQRNTGPTPTTGADRGGVQPVGGVQPPGGAGPVGGLSGLWPGHRNTGPTHTTGADRGPAGSSGGLAAYSPVSGPGDAGRMAGLTQPGGTDGYSDWGGPRSLVMGDPDAHMGSNTPAGRAAGAAADAGVRMAPDASRRNQQATASAAGRHNRRPPEERTAETAGHRAETQIQQARAILARAIARQAGRSGGNTFSDRMGDRVLQKGFSSLSGR